MNKTGIRVLIAGGVLIAALVIVQHNQPPPQETPYARSEGQPEAAPSGFVLKTVAGEETKPHVLFVNVGEAVPDDVFLASQKEVQVQVRVNMRVASLPELHAADLVARWDGFQAAIGTQACVTVFVVNDAQGRAFLNCPSVWSLINVRSLKHGEPTAEVYQKRVTKMLMKGLAHSVGIGGNQDARCVLFYKSFCMEGIDATSASYSPFAYFPLSETLTALGGAALAHEPAE